MKGLGQHTGDQREAKTAGEYRQAAEEHTQTLKSFWKNFLVSGLFVVAAVVIILACLAWFFNNSQVTATGVGVSAAGVRYNLLTNYTEEEQQNSKQGIYDSKIGVVNGMLVNENSNFNNTTEGSTLFPGASGKFNLKVQKVASDLRDVNVAVKLDPQLKNAETSDNEVDALLKGHIQFFTGINGQFYEAPVLSDGKGNRVISVLSDSYDDNKEHEFTVYWVWPERFSNIIATGGSRYDKNLFAGTKDTGYEDFLKFLNTNKGYFFKDVAGIPEEISNDMGNTEFVKCTNQYDAADDYLGNNVSYIKVSFEAEEVPPQDGGK